jgi:chaperonin GroES
VHGLRAVADGRDASPHRRPLETRFANRYYWHSLDTSANNFPWISFLAQQIGDAFMKIRPLHDRLIVKRLEEERKTASGIVIPDSAAEKPDQGEVKAIGKGKVLEDGKVRAIDLKVGDRVLFGKYSGQTVKVDGDELLVMREEDIMGVIE